MDFQFKFICTSTTTDDEQTAATTQKQRLKRRNVAIFFAYCGVGYQGMQKNPGAKTIEGDLEEAIYLSGAVPEQDRLSVEVWDLMSRFIDQYRNDVYRGLRLDIGFVVNNSIAFVYARVIRFS